MSDMPKSSQSADRQGAAVAGSLQLPAIIQGEGLEAKSCRISLLDQQQLLINFTSQAEQERVYVERDKLINKAYQANFRIKHKDVGEKTYTLRFILKDCEKTGAKAVLKDTEPQILKLLQQLASRAQKKSQQKGQATNTSAATVWKPTAAGITQRIGVFLDDYATALELEMSSLLQDTEDESNEEKDEYFHALEFLSMSQADFCQEIGQAITNQLEGKETLTWESIQEQTNGNSLSLVDDSQLESYLVINSIISSAEMDNRELLFKVAKRISQLYKQDFSVEKNPIGFEIFFRTIETYLSSRRFGFHALEVASKMMKKILQTELVTLYEEMTQGFEVTYESKKSTDSNTRKRSSPGSESNTASPSSTKVQTQLEPHQQPSPTAASMNNLNQQNPVNQQVPVQTHSGQDQAVVANHSNNSVAPQDNGGNYLPGNNNSFPSLNPDQGSHTDVAHTSMQKDEQRPLDEQGLSTSISAFKQGVQSVDALRNIQLSARQAELAANVQEPFIHQDQRMSATQQQGLLEVLNQIQHENYQKWQNGEQLEIVAEKLPGLMRDKHNKIEGGVEVALNRMTNMFGHLEKDQYVSSSIRNNLKRMESVLYKQAVMEDGNFLNSENPLRNIVNQFEELDLNGGGYDQTSELMLDQLVGEMLSLDQFDQANLENISNNVQQLIDKQVTQNKARVSKLVEQADREYSTLAEFKKEDDQPRQNSSEKLAASNKEYKVWHDRVSSMSPGDSIVIDVNGDKVFQNLAWVSPDRNRYIFVDNQGNKVADMTHQELSVRLLKGSADITDDHQKPLFDRAITSSLFNEYSEIKDQLTRDSETGFLTSEKFQSELDIVCLNTHRDETEHALFHLSFTHNDHSEMLASMASVASKIDSLFGKHCLIGRYEEDTLLFVAEYLDREGVVKEADKLWAFVSQQLAQPRVSVSIGICLINQHCCDKEVLLDQASAANDKAQYLDTKKVSIYELEIDLGSEKQDSFDWASWIQEHSEPENTLPLFTQTLLFKGEKKTKPLLYIFPAVEDYLESKMTPEHFIKVSKDSDLIPTFEKKYIQQTLNWISENKRLVAKFSRCLINLSAASIEDKSLLDFVIEKLSQSIVPPGKLCFNVPAGLGEENKDKLSRFMRTLTEFGCHFAIRQMSEDGADQSMLKLPVSYICLDQSLSISLVDDAQSFGLIKSLNDIAHMLDKLTVVNYGVDQQSQELLNEIKVDFISDHQHSPSLLENTMPTEAHV